MRGLKDRWSARLSLLERKVRNGEPLAPADRALKQQIQAAAGFGASERVRSQRGLRERLRRGLEASGRYDAKFREVFRPVGLPEDFSYLPDEESSLQNHARPRGCNRRQAVHSL